MRIDKYNESDTVKAIYNLHEQQNVRRPQRRMGAAQVGEGCPRKLWYSFRHAGQSRIEGRVLRLFQTGHLQEDRLLRELVDCGIQVWWYQGQLSPGYDNDPNNPTPPQIIRTAIYGHFVFKADAVVKGIPEAPKTAHLAEFKTANDKSFKDIVNKGIKLSKPGYYTQAQVGAYLLGLKRILFLVVNKNNDEIYGERLRMDKEYAEEKLRRAQNIIFSEEAPKRISEDPSFWQCRFCNYYDICHTGEHPDRACRNCLHSTPEKTQDGAWTCARQGREYGEVCEDHLYLPTMLSKYTLADAGEDWVLYNTENGEQWQDGNQGSE